MAYTGGNSGYVRRLGKIPSFGGGGGGGAPADGYAAWFDAAVSIYADIGATTPATDGSTVRAWTSRGGSLGGLTLIKSAISGNDCVYQLSGINALPAIKYISDASLVSSDNLSDGTLVRLAPETGHVIFTVHYTPADPITGGPIYGPSNAFAMFHDGGNHRSYISTTGGYAIANKAAPYAVTHIFTRLLTDEGLYAGVDDTRTASMTRVALPGTPNGYLLDRIDLPNRNYTISNMLIAEVLFYPSALSEADRKTTEQYLAAKYGITLPY